MASIGNSYVMGIVSFTVHRTNMAAMIYIIIIHISNKIPSQQNNQNID